MLTWMPDVEQNLHYFVVLDNWISWGCQFCTTGSLERFCWWSCKYGHWLWMSKNKMLIMVSSMKILFVLKGCVIFSVKNQQRFFCPQTKKDIEVTEHDQSKRMLNVWISLKYISSLIFFQDILVGLADSGVRSVTKWRALGSQLISRCSPKAFSLMVKWGNSSWKYTWLVIPESEVWWHQMKGVWTRWTGLG